ncbi:MAG: RNA methyltransferase PUA domain-containing protein, partial [Bacteroidota bacterium]
MTTQHFVSPEGIDGDEVRFDPDEARHLFKVLRCRPSDEVEVIDGEGGWYRVRLDVVERRGASGTVLERRRDVGEPRAACTIAVGTLKSE